MSIAAWIFVALHFLLWQALSVYVNYNSWLLWRAWRLRQRCPVPPPAEDFIPTVTVQLPIYNEPEVIVRLLRAIGRLDYPHERLQIQLLDDSTDGVTTPLAATVVAQLRQQGLRVEHVCRSQRRGYKAGALHDAMASATGELFLLLDADFVPAPDLLQRLVPWFSDPSVGMVQAKWGELQPPRNLAERASSSWMRRHFEIEQVARSGSGHFFHFNGSAGMWRREAIEACGGWTADTLAEDFDLSYRAWRKGWKFIYDGSKVVPADLPPDIPALKVQQARWAQGSFQVARKVWPTLVELPFWTRVYVFLHTTGYAFPVLLLWIVLTSGPAAWGRESLSFWWAFWLIDFWTAAFALGMLMQVFYRLKIDGWRAGRLEVETAAIGLGLSWLILRRGLRGLARDGGEFVRTPKASGQAAADVGQAKQEAILGVLALGSAVTAMYFGAWFSVWLPLLAGVGLLFCAVGTMAYDGTVAAVRAEEPLATT